MERKSVTRKYGEDWTHLCSFCNRKIHEKDARVVVSEIVKGRAFCNGTCLRLFWLGK